MFLSAKYVIEITGNCMLLQFHFYFAVNRSKFALKKILYLWQLQFSLNFFARCVLILIDAIVQINGTIGQNLRTKLIKLDAK